MSVESETTTGTGSGTVVGRALDYVANELEMRKILAGYALVVGVFVYLPMISVILFSFSSSGSSFPIEGFTTRWYSVMLADGPLIASITSSLQLAAVVMVITTTMATGAALAYRHQFVGKRALLYLVILGIITPGITYSVGATLFLNEILGLPRGLWSTIPVHVVWTFPFAFIILLAGIPPNLAEQEDAARVMGLSERKIFTKITLPQIWSTILGAAVFALTLSYNEGTRSILLLGSDNTMPVYVFSTIASTGTGAEMLALGAVTTFVSIVLLGIGGVLLLRY
ncbi:ABC transporter permease [Halorarius halobius]|uniref:ABC transporter permease n=1 Tax=Halorarius halobius TaxID=2962671 RepID=UPI0020CC3137|nr:ABC transporter permease subunit [Halorarius halobius]